MESSKPNERVFVRPGDPYAIRHLNQDSNQGLNQGTVWFVVRQGFEDADLKALQEQIKERQGEPLAFDVEDEEGKTREEKTFTDSAGKVHQYIAWIELPDTDLPDEEGG